MSNAVRSPRAISIREAANHVGLSRGQFYREFINANRVTPIKTGKRDRIVLIKELDSAFDQYVAEKRATK